MTQIQPKANQNKTNCDVVKIKSKQFKKQVWKKILVKEGAFDQQDGSLHIMSRFR